MGDLTRNISRHELMCRCGNCRYTIDEKDPIVQIIQKTCDYFAKVYSVKKVALQVTSAARCWGHNEKVGGSDGSYHLRGRAMDIKIFIDLNEQVKPKLVYKYLDRMFPEKLGLGKYETFTHVDTRPYKSRWGEGV